MTMWRMKIACWIPVQKKHTFGIWKTYCFTTATVVARTPSVLRNTSIVYLVIYWRNNFISRSSKVRHF